MKQGNRLSIHILFVEIHIALMRIRDILKTGRKEHDLIWLNSVLHFESSKVDWEVEAHRTASPLTATTTKVNASYTEGSQ